MYNNAHWFSDVGFGILSTKIAYRIYPTIAMHISFFA